MADLVTFGETMLRLSPPGDTPIEVAETFDIHAAGAESNVAVAAQRLGVEATWLSKVPDSPPGRRVTGALRRHGVDTAVVRSEDGRQGTYYLEAGDRPRGASVWYDREGAAVHSATAAELPTDRVEEATAFHTTGITPALSETLAETTADLLSRASAAGTTTVFDLNYRSKLWSPAEAEETVRNLLPAVDVFVVARRDAETVLSASGDAEATVRELAGSFDFQTTVLTCSEDGALAVRDGDLFEQAAFPATDAHPVGTGDAFVGGYLARWLQGGDVADALEYGAATAALKRATPGDVAVVTPEEVERVLGAETADIER